VVIQLSGGNYGLNTVISYENDQYYHIRPTIAVSRSEVLTLNSDFGLHPVMRDLKDLYERELPQIVHGVGYPNPDRSHFRSMEIWQTGIAEDFETSGWIGRLFDHNCNNGHLKQCSPTLAASIGSTRNPAIPGESGIGIAVTSPERLSRMTRLLALSEPETPTTSDDSQLDFIRRTTLNAQLSADKISKAVRTVQRQTEYPHTTDFRSLYASVIEERLGLPSQSVLQKQFEKLQLLNI